VELPQTISSVLTFTDAHIRAFCLKQTTRKTPFFGRLQNNILAQNIPLPTQTELTTFLQQKEIPAIIPRKRTFFDISGVPHDELIISSWYAYFLRVDEDHGLGNLFLQALIMLIGNKKGHSFSLNEFVVETEVTTQTRKRIDILIRGIGKDEGKFIIIENKIYHWVNNDLEDYWHHCATADTNKCGVLLTLNRMPVPSAVSSMFINVLHAELIEAIQSLQVDRQTTSKYLPDFVAAIDNLYKDYFMDNEVSFYFENLALCNRIYDISLRAHDFVVGHIKIAAQHLGLQFAGKSEHYRYLFQQNLEGVYYTIIFDQIFAAQQKIHIAIELDQNGLSMLSEIDLKVGEQKVKDRGLLYQSKDQKGVWLHYAGRGYQVIPDDLRNLSIFIAGKIKEDFSDFFQEVSKVLISHAPKTVS
jgi:hypothetical protein